MNPRLTSSLATLAASVVLAMTSTPASSQALELGASAGSRFGGGGGNSESVALYGSEALAAGMAQAGAAARNVLLPALQDIPFDVLPSGPVSAGLTSGAMARLQPGSIGVRTWADAAGYVVVGANDPAANYAASSYASVRYQERFTVTGDGPISTRLRAEVLFDIDNSIVSLSDQAAGAGSSYMAKIDYWWNSGSATFVVCTWSSTCGAPVDPGLYAFDKTVQVASGTEFWVTTSMFSSSEAGLYNAVAASITGGIASSELYSWQSLRHGVELLTPGATLSAPNGHDYVFTPHTAPVPEPGTVALMAIGLAAVGLNVRRRRRDVAA